MRQNGFSPNAEADIISYFRQSLPSQEETLGQVVGEILRAGKNLNRAAVCAKLVSRMELASSPEEERHYHELIGLLFGR